MESETKEIRHPQPSYGWLWLILSAVGVCTLLLIGACAILLYLTLRQFGTAPRPSGDDRAYLLERLRSPVRSIAVSPDGKLVAAGCHDGSIHLWDIKTGDPGPVMQGHRGIVASLVFTPDGQSLASASHDKLVMVWDVKTGQAKKTFPGHRVAAWSISVAGTIAASAGPFDDTHWPVPGEVRVWDLTPGKEKDMGAVPAKFGGITSLAIAPDGASVFVASTDGDVTRWHLATQKVQATYTGHNQSVWALALSKDGKQVAAGAENGQIRLWDVDTQVEQHVLLGIPNPVQNMSFTPDGKVLVAVAYDKTIRFWDTHSGKLVASVKDEEMHSANLAIAPDGKTLVTGRVFYDQFQNPLAGDVKVWDLDRLVLADLAKNPPIKAPVPNHPRKVLHINGKYGVRLSDSVNLLDLNKDFTIEMWVRFNADNRRILYLAGDEAWPTMNPKVQAKRTSGWVLRTRPAADNSVALDFTVACEEGDGKSGWVTAKGEPEKVKEGFQHLAVCRSGNQITLYWNGRRHASLACADKRFVSSPTDCFIGVRENALADRVVTADFAEFQLSARARYVKDFTPPPTIGIDPESLCSLNFSNANGAEIMDRSGKNHNGLFPPDTTPQWTRAVVVP